MNMNNEVYEPCPCRFSFFRTERPPYMLLYPSPDHIVAAQYQIFREAIVIHSEQSKPTAMPESTVGRLEEHFAFRRC